MVRRFDYELRVGDERKTAVMIPVMKPRLPSERQIRKYLRRIDDARVYTNFGPLCNELTIRLAEYFGVNQEELILLSNGTLALQGAITTSTGPGHVWNCPSWTFVATGQAITSSGCTPNFVDVDHLSWIASSTFKEKSSSAITVPFGAQPQLHQHPETNKESFKLFDAASCFDACFNIGRSQGVSPHSAIMVSLHATKLMTTGEGGVLIGPSDWIQEVRKWSNFGFYGDRIAKVIATNAKMSEYQAAIGLASLDSWSETRELWQNTIEKLKKAMEGIGIKGQPALNNGFVTSTFVAVLPSVTAKKLVLEALDENGIESRDWWADGVHKMPIFSKFAPAEPLVNTEFLSMHTLGIPLYIDLAQKDIESIARVIDNALTKSEGL